MHPASPNLPLPLSLGEIKATRRIALFLDFDGTLVEIAARPDAIRVPDTLGLELHRAGEALGGRIAVVSGRPVSELRSYLGDPQIALAGSHGLELFDTSGDRVSGEPPVLDQASRIAILSFAERWPDILVEEKPFGLALHYRTAPAHEADVRRFADRLVRTHNVALKRGKCVVEFVVPGATKRAAVEGFMASPAFSGALPVFVGDDETDEDGFAAAVDLGGWGIAVGERVSRNASFHLETPAAVRDWIKRGI